MYVPQSYAVALILMLASMACWGSWPNFLKKVPGWRLEYFYFDYTLGFLVTVCIYGLTLGSDGTEQGSFLARLLHGGAREVWFALVGGFIWNVGNILLLNSIMIAGLAVAYPIAATPTIVLGIGVSYWLQPVGKPWALAISATLLLVAAQVIAAAYRRLGSEIAANKSKGIATALVSGVLIGFFPPFVTAAISGPAGLDSYTVSALFMLGAGVATLVVIPLLLKRPLIGVSGVLGGYLEGRASWHVLGLLAGAAWCTGTVFNFISAGMVGVAISVGIGSGAPMVGALWGIFLWREFAHSELSAKVLIAAALALYTVGIAIMAVAYTTAGT
jgi:glucose uptake protein